MVPWKKRVSLLKDLSGILTVNTYHEAYSVMCVIIATKLILPQILYLRILKSDVLRDVLCGVLA